VPSTEHELDRFTHLGMTASRLAQFGASVVGSWIAGIVGAFLVWNYIYSIGTRVIEDETYYRLEDAVTRCGGVAGVSVALATVLLLRRPAPGVLVAGHAFATLAGFLGGSVGWQEGLWAYFGALVAFVFGVAFRALFPWRHMEAEVVSITRERSCRAQLRNDLLIVFAEPLGVSLRLGDRLRFVGLSLDSVVRVENLSQGNGFTVYVQAINVHDLRLPMAHGTSRTPSTERLAQP